MTKGEKIRLLRTSLDLTLKDVAKAIGVSKQTAQRYETGEITNIPSDKIEKLAAVLRTSPGYIMGWDEEKNDKGVVYVDKDRQIIVQAIADLSAEELEFIEEYLKIKKKIQ